MVVLIIAKMIVMVLMMTFYTHASNVPLLPQPHQLVLSAAVTVTTAAQAELVMLVISQLSVELVADVGLTRDQATALPAGILPPPDVSQLQAVI